MGTRMKVESNFINFELNEKEITGYKLVLETKNAKYAKSNDTYQTLKITGDVQRIVTNNELIYKMIKDWTKIRYGMSADFYVKVTVTQIVMDEVFREIVFPNAYMQDFTETLNPNTGEGSFEITLLQKIDKIDDIVINPFDGEFREKEFEESTEDYVFTSYYREPDTEPTANDYILSSPEYKANFYKSNNFEYSAESDEYGRVYKNDKIFKKPRSINEVLNDGYRFCGMEKDTNYKKIYKFNKELSEMYMEKDGEKEYLGTGYIIKEENSAVNYAIEPPKVFEKLGYKIINNETSYYQIEGKNGTFKINKVKRNYIAQNETFYLNNIKMRDLINILKDDINYTWNYSSKVLIITIKQETKETIEIAPWLIGYKGKPKTQGGRSVTYSEEEWNKLDKINPSLPIDWYSYENRTAPNGYVSPYLEDQKYVSGNYGELMDKNKQYYWVTLGPKVLIPDYPNEGKLVTEDFKDHIGCRIDVVLHNDKNDMYVYIECLFSGNIKAHTFDNGIYQTGHPYPNSSSAKSEPYNTSYVNGSFIEFTGKDPGDNGTMSQYSLVEIIVYPK